MRQFLRFMVHHAAIRLSRSTPARRDADGDRPGKFRWTLPPIGEEKCPDSIGERVVSISLSAIRAQVGMSVPVRVPARRGRHEKPNS